MKTNRTKSLPGITPVAVALLLALSTLLAFAAVCADCQMLFVTTANPIWGCSSCEKDEDEPCSAGVMCWYSQSCFFYESSPAWVTECTGSWVQVNEPAGQTVNLRLRTVTGGACPSEGLCRCASTVRGEYNDPPQTVQKRVTVNCPGGPPSS
jgi:hypothetical protein